MTIKEANEILKEYNVWRRGGDVPHARPKILGEAIDTITEFVDSKLNG